MTFKEVRESKGLSQTELARRVGLKQTTISQYENGLRSPSLLMAKKLAEALGMTLDDFSHVLTPQNKIKIKQIYAYINRRRLHHASST